MCGMCPDVIASCHHLECGARERIDPETGNRRPFYMRHFIAGEIPCAHELEGHKPDCPLRRGFHCDDLECDD